MNIALLVLVAAVLNFDMYCSFVNYLLGFNVSDQWQGCLTYSYFSSLSIIQTFVLVEIVLNFD